MTRSIAGTFRRIVSASDVPIDLDGLFSMRQPSPTTACVRVGAEIYVENVKNCPMCSHDRKGANRGGYAPGRRMAVANLTSRVGVTTSHALTPASALLFASLAGVPIAARSLMQDP